MLFWLILLIHGINANQVVIRQMEFTVLSNSYFDTNETSSTIIQKTIPKSDLTAIDCSRLCIDVGSSCSIVVYNDINQTCSIYNTIIGIQRTSSCCTTFINRETEESIVLPVILPPNPQVSSTANLLTGRRSHTATLLSSGQVLIAGGRDSSTILSSCELYHPQYQNWTTAASLSTPRARHTATILTINNVDLVFVIGGEYTTAYDPLSSVEYYNISSNTWITIGNRMNDARYSHSTTILLNGRLLITGGANLSSRLASTEIFDPMTLTWQTVGSLNEARFQHMDTILSNGNVLIAGGAILPDALQSCEIFDFNLQTWSLVQNMTYARNLGSMVSLMSISSSILITGGTKVAGLTYSTTELYYPSTNTITASSDMTYQRFAHSSNLVYYQSTPLVVVIGGYDSLYNGINSIQLFVVANSTWINIPGLTTRRGEHTATLLNTSPLSILIIGGRTDASTSSVLNNVEILSF